MGRVQAQQQEPSQEIGEYLSAISNGAELHGKRTGYSPWGIDDGTHSVLGTKFRPKQAKKGNEQMESWLLHQLNPRIDFTIHEFERNGAPVVLFTFQAANSTPVRFSGEAYIRVGSEWTTAQIVEAYRGQSRVEAAFRDLKDPGMLSTRPQFHWTAQKLHVHAFMCVVGTVTLLYDHHVRQLSDKLIALQHRFHQEILSTLHVHLDHHNRLEVIVVKGTSGNVQKLADLLIAAKGVKHGKLVVTAAVDVL